MTVPTGFRPFKDMDWSAFAGAENCPDGSPPSILELDVSYQGKYRAQVCCVFGGDAMAPSLYGIAVCIGLAEVEGQKKTLDQLVGGFNEYVYNTNNMDVALEIAGMIAAFTKNSRPISLETLGFLGFCRR